MMLTVQRTVFYILQIGFWPIRSSRPFLNSLSCLLQGSQLAGASSSIDSQSSACPYPKPHICGQPQSLQRDSHIKSLVMCERFVFLHEIFLALYPFLQYSLGRLSKEQILHTVIKRYSQHPHCTEVEELVTSYCNCHLNDPSQQSCLKIFPKHSVIIYVVRITGERKSDRLYHKFIYTVDDEL